MENILKHPFVQSLQSLGKNTWRFFFDAACLDRAASIAYSTLLAIVPLLLIGISLTHFWNFSPEVVDKMIKHLLEPLNIQATGAIYNGLISLLTQPKTYSWPIVGCMLFSTFLLVSNLQSTFDAVWSIQPHQRKPYLTLLHTFIIIWIPVSTTLLISIESILSAYTGSIHLFLSINRLFDLINIFISILLLSCCYWLLPSIKIKFSNAFLSALIASSLITVAKKTLTWYFLEAKQYSLFYGSLQMIPIFLLWVYIICVIIVAGCAICRALSKIN